VLIVIIIKGEFNGIKKKEVVANFCLQELKKAMKTPRQDSLWPHRDFTSRYLPYERQHLLQDETANSQCYSYKFNGYNFFKQLNL